MSDTIRDGVMVTVAGTLLASFLLWLFGLLKPAWRFLRELPPHVRRFFRKSRDLKKGAAVVTEVPPSKPAPIDADPQLDQLRADA